MLDAHRKAIAEVIAKYPNWDAMPRGQQAEALRLNTTFVHNKTYAYALLDKYRELHA